MSAEADTKREKLKVFDQGFTQAVPHNRALGLRFIDFADGEATILLPFAEHLVGNPETGVLHGGAVTSLLDATCGAAVFMRLKQPMPIATLDLRIDYLRRGEPRRDVICKANCFKVTHHIAFVRGLAYHDSEDDPIAAAAGSFMIQGRGRPIVGGGER
ncbi:MAG: PaaI family thioesterase [Myxococcales bacterium]|nr:PaaI family thioesterase [Myxococcales bacterium]